MSISIGKNGEKSRGNWKKLGKNQKKRNPISIEASNFKSQSKYQISKIQKSKIKFQISIGEKIEIYRYIHITPPPPLQNSRVAPIK
jgi:hypothetical protein